MSNRKRVNMTLSPEQYAIIDKIRRDYRFDSVCDVCSTITTVCVNLIVSGEYNPTHQETGREYIARMFRGFAEAEPAPERTDIYRRRHNTATLEDMEGSAPGLGLLPRNNGSRAWVNEQRRAMMEEQEEADSSTDE